MPINISYQPNAATLGQAANMAGFSEWLAEQDRITEQKRQFNEQQQLRVKAQELDAKGQDWRQGFAYDQLGLEAQGQFARQQLAANQLELESQGQGQRQQLAYDEMAQRQYLQEQEAAQRQEEVDTRWMEAAQRKQDQINALHAAADEKATERLFTQKTAEEEALRSTQHLRTPDQNAEAWGALNSKYEASGLMPATGPPQPQLSPADQLNQEEQQQPNPELRLKWVMDENGVPVAVNESQVTEIRRRITAQEEAKAQETLEANKAAAEETKAVRASALEQKKADRQAILDLAKLDVESAKGTLEMANGNRPKLADFKKPGPIIEGTGLPGPDVMDSVAYKAEYDRWNTERERASGEYRKAVGRSQALMSGTPYKEEAAVPEPPANELSMPAAPDGATLNEMKQLIAAIEARPFGTPVSVKGGAYNGTSITVDSQEELDAIKQSWGL